MKSNVVAVRVRGLLPSDGGVAIFLGNEDKVFVVQVEHGIGMMISMLLREIPRERPLTHDLMTNIFKGFGISVENVVITELRNSVYYARLFLKQENELGTKIVEIDARPSDCIAIAIANKKPIYVTRTLFDQVEDMSAFLSQIEKEEQGEEDESSQ
ncbi:MAG: bifunctional nuclease family protein [Verrucomicrobiae bacterium]|nr:bifunctional nuclease family protein [Verrucomicrobiae bacterium]